MAKAVNQVMIAGTYASVGEGIALAQAAGLPIPELLDALSAGAAGSWVLTNRAGNMVDDSYPLGFKLALHRKDLGDRPRRGRAREPPLGGHADQSPSRRTSSSPRGMATRT